MRWRCGGGRTTRPRRSPIRTSSIPRLRPALREQVRELVSHLADQENTLLNLNERKRLINEVLDETFGLGPLEVLLTDLVLLSIWSFSRRRACLTGLFVGLAFLAKVNAVVLGPVLLLALSLREPRRMLQRDIWKGVGVGLLIVSPLVLRFLWLETSGMPWSEESLLFERLTPDMFRASGSYEAHFFRVPEVPLPLADNSVSDWLDIVILNTMNNLFFGTKGAFDVDIPF